MRSQCDKGVASCFESVILFPAVSLPTDFSASVLAMFLLIAIGFILKRYGTQAVPLPTPSPASAAFSATIFARDTWVQWSNGP